jgi:hypothetical protein
MMKRTKGTHKALGRGGRARVTEITIKSKPIKIPMRAREAISRRTEARK